MGFIKRSNLERRRMRWSSSKNTWKTFLLAIMVAAIFITIIGLFTWGMISMFSALGVGSTAEAATLATTFLL